MIVAIDTKFLAGQLRQTGTGTYLFNLLTECVKIGGAAGIEFHGFRKSQGDLVGNGLDLVSVRLHETKLIGNDRMWRFGGMAISTLRLKPDLVFLPTAQGPIAPPFIPVVTTLLDAIPKRLPPRFVEAGTTAHHIAWINARHATKVITISEWSKRDILEIYGLAPENVQVTYLGYNRALYNTTPPDREVGVALLARLGIHRPFILHHGMVQLRKNLSRLIEAWDRVLEQKPGFDVQLVLAGPMGLGHEEILKVRQSSPNRDRIILTGALSDEHLAHLIKNAWLCVIPSLYEGFCLPMVEAMACGIPTVASNNSCLPEVSGHALEYFDPRSIEEMAQVIRRGLEDSELRTKLQERGLAQVAQFSWERCARETLDIFVQAQRQSGTEKVKLSSAGV